MQLELSITPEGCTIEIEEWREVIGFPRYECSTMGRFRNKASGLMLSGTKAHNGYVHIGLTTNGRQLTRLAHRLIALTWLEQATPKHSEVHHHNKQRTDNRRSNLSWTTRSQNQLAAHRA